MKKMIATLTIENASKIPATKPKQKSKPFLATHTGQIFLKIHKE